MLSCTSPRREQVEELFDLLPHETPSRGLGAEACSFGTGAYAKGPLQGLRKECGTFPQSTRLLTAFVQSCFPDHNFTTAILFCNAQTDLHIDSKNHRSPNAVMGISAFENGQIWVGDDQGAVPKQVGGRTVWGTLLDVATSPVRFDAWRFPHCTENWQGRRLVLVAFSVKSLDRISPADLHHLKSLGFRPPGVLDQGVVHADQETPPLCRPASAPWVFELFSGRGQLSRALWSSGFQVLSIDSVCSNAASPTAKLNVAHEQARRIVCDLLAEYRPFAVHLGAPCATVLPGGLRSSGQALRSKTQPLGLPTLDEASSSRVRAANAVYRFCYELLRHCLRHDINVSLDNPADSFLWHIFEHFAQSDGLWWPLAGLDVVMFDNCCHGGPRPTQRRVVASTGLLNRLSAACPRNHYHEPWGSPATPTADAYPLLLAKRWSDCFATRAEAQGLSLSSASEFHAISLAATARQSRKFQPLLPEFREIAYMPVSFCPDKSCKILLSHDSTGDAEGANRLLPVTQNRSRSPV